MGAITPIGLSVDEFWASVKEGKTGFGTISKFDASEYKCHVVICASLFGYIAIPPSTEITCPVI